MSFKNVNFLCVHVCMYMCICMYNVNNYALLTHVAVIMSNLIIIFVTQTFRALNYNMSV